MSLSQEQSQLLQYYMQKNRNFAQPVQAPQLPQQSSSGGPDIASILGTLGGWMDKTVPGSLQPGQMGPPRPVIQQSGLSKFADRLDPQGTQQKAIIDQFLKMGQQPDIKKLLMQIGMG